MGPRLFFPGLYDLSKDSMPFPLLTYQTIFYFPIIILMTVASIIIYIGPIIIETNRNFTLLTIYNDDALSMSMKYKSHLLEDYLSRWIFLIWEHSFFFLSREIALNKIQ